MTAYVKERTWAPAGSIPAVLGMFEAEVRFYNEIAPALDLRVPRCLSAVITPSGTRLELEDLSQWAAGGDPVRVAQLLRALHDQWLDKAASKWPWLRRAGMAADLIGALFDREWMAFADRTQLRPKVRDLGARLVGNVEAAELAEAAIMPHTVVHGDASLANVRTGPTATSRFSIGRTCGSDLVSPTSRGFLSHQSSPILGTR